MIILIAGSVYTGKTKLAQSLLEKYNYPYLSIDHLKMGLIRSKSTDLTAYDDDKLVDYLWPIVTEIIKTAIENNQNMILEGIYIPFDWKNDFSPGEIKEIEYFCLVMSEAYIESNFDLILEKSNIIEKRLGFSTYSKKEMIEDNLRNLEECKKHKLAYILIEGEYEKALEKINDTPTIMTERLILRKFTIADVNALFEIFSDRETNRFLPWHPLENIEEAKTFLQERFLSYYDKSSSYRYAICLQEDNKPIGYVWLSDDESRDLGYGLKKEFWNKGIITEAAKAVIERIKREGLDYITATHDKNNIASGEVMKKIGMEYKYSYVEQWQPKDISVTFRMYQLNFDGNKKRTYMKYWDTYQEHFIEDNL